MPNQARDLRHWSLSKHIFPAHTGTLLHSLARHGITAHYNLAFADISAVGDSEDIAQFFNKRHSRTERKTPDCVSTGVFFTYIRGSIQIRAPSRIAHILGARSDF
jgi:hypothetical protein